MVNTSDDLITCCMLLQWNTGFCKRFNVPLNFALVCKVNSASDKELKAWHLITYNMQLY